MEAGLIKYNIEESIYFIRGQKVMLSGHLADLYEVEPRALIQAVKRNTKRFPSDFMFLLSIHEVRALRSQNVILENGKGRHSKYPEYAFTQEGVAMLSGVLKENRELSPIIPRAYKIYQNMCVDICYTSRLYGIIDKLGAKNVY